MDTPDEDDIWTNVALPVWREAHEQLEAGKRPLVATHIAGALGMSVEDVRAAGAILSKRGHIEVKGTAHDPVVRLVAAATPPA